MIKLRLPLQHIFVNQDFGENQLGWYEQWGLLGHNGIDFKANIGCIVYAQHDGEVIISGTDADGGKEIRLWNREGRFLTGHYHCSELLFRVGDFVMAGTPIALTGNTGTYTTGAHLHNFMKFTDASGNTINNNNGYRGAVNQSQYFAYTYNGIEIKQKDWDKSRCYHRYYRGRPLGGLINEVKVLAALGKYLKRLPSSEQINACTYGGWDRETVKQEAQFENWSQLKKEEFVRGFRPFRNN